MKKRIGSARPLLVRNRTYRIDPQLLSRIGEAVMFASPIVILFFHLWLGLVLLLAGGGLVLAGYRLAEPEQFAFVRSQTYLLLKRVATLWRRNPPH